MDKNISENSNRKYYIFLFTLFLCSFITRWYSIAECPIGMGFIKNILGDKISIIILPNVSVHDLFMFEVWDKFSISIHHFVCGIGYSPDTFALNKLDSTGWYSVYTSFPPISFVVPYFISKLLHITADSSFLQTWSLLLDYVSSFIVFEYVRELLSKNEYKNRIAIICTIFYIFCPNLMEYSVNTYWAHNFLQPFYILSLYFIAKYKSEISNKLLFIICFWLSFITWTGLFISFGILVSYLIYSLDKQQRIKRFFVISTAVASACIINGIWMTSVLDVKSYFSQLLSRFIRRSSSPQDFLKDFIGVICLEYGPTIIFCVLILVIVLLFYKNNTDDTDKFNIFVPILVSGITCLESILLMNHDYIYGFGRIKYIIFFVTIIAVLIRKIKWNEKIKIILSILIVATVIVNIISFYEIYCSDFDKYVLW